jgi:hypothetical protein
LTLAGLGIAVALLSPVSAQDNADCLECHASAGLKVERDGRDISLYVDEERLDESVHSGMDCIECHMDLEGIEKYPHAKDLERVNCGECHEDDDGPIAAYWQSTHGQRVREGDEHGPCVRAAIQDITSCRTTILDRPSIKRIFGRRACSATA